MPPRTDNRPKFFTMEQNIRYIGFVRSRLKNLEDCSLQEDEGAPDAEIIIAAESRSHTLSPEIFFEGLYHDCHPTLPKWPRRS